jgi:glutamine synthetase
MAKSLSQLLHDHGYDIIHVGQFDNMGLFRERRLRRDQFLQWAAEPRFANVVGHWDAGEALFGGGPYRTEELEIDTASLRPFGFEARSAAIIADLAGQYAPIMPRNVLKAQIARAAEMGFDVRAAFEFEVIFLNETASSLRARGFAPPAQFAADNKCWSGTTAATEAAFVTAWEQALLAHGIDLFGVGGELGPGCFEATLGATNGLKAADDASFFRLASRAFARQRNMTATFMPSLGPDYPGLGGHVTLSLIDKATGRNLFADPAGETNALARNFIGGMTQIVPEAFALCAHTVNAYRRFAPGTWAPKSVSWSDWCFTTAVRSCPSAGDTARLEFRLPGTDCNTHLTLALMLGAGLDGIARGLQAPDPSPNSGPDDIVGARLPGTLPEAAARLAASDHARRLFGGAFIDNFTAFCAAETASLAREVSDAERRRYLEG